MPSKRKNNICELHKCEMVKKDIKISYGLPPAPVAGYSEAKDILFPNCDDYILGGCCVSSSSPRRTKRDICEKCNKERKKWKKLHRSEISFETSIDIKDNIVLVLNNEIIEIDKSRIIQDYFCNCIALPNNTYQISVRNKDTGTDIASLEVELKKEYVVIKIFIDDKNNISIKAGYKSKMKDFVTWY